jgi:hypothetical protein
LTFGIVEFPQPEKLPENANQLEWAFVGFYFSSLWIGVAAF